MCNNCNNDLEIELTLSVNGFLKPLLSVFSTETIDLLNDDLVNLGYYMAARGYEFNLGAVKDTTLDTATCKLDPPLLERVSVVFSYFKVNLVINLSALLGS